MAKSKGGAAAACIIWVAFFAFICLLLGWVSFDQKFNSILNPVSEGVEDTFFIQMQQDPRARNLEACAREERLISRGVVVSRDQQSPFRKNEHSYVFPRRSDPLPKIAIVTFAFGASTQKNKYEMSALQCYAAIHGYPMYIEHFQLQTDRAFIFTKLRTILKYLPHFQWILYVDSDVVIANRSRRIEEFLDSNYDFIFQERDSNWEWFTNAFFVKNTDYALSFVNQWLSMSDDNKAPFGMGDQASLVSLLLRDFQPPGYKDCLAIEQKTNGTTPERHRREVYNAEMIPCFYRVTRMKDFEHFKVLEPLQGFLRSFEITWQPASYYRKLFPEVEFLLHGKYAISEIMTVADVYCEAVDAPEQARPELWHTKESAAEAAEQMGLKYLSAPNSEELPQSPVER
mmetsp:Transcript_22397/g.37011  ORF Transcript_22397/g.37011 Transcript_22397/m.37011 type:complete len:400 (-) Transcript_22397:237-1436(-)|eukprot:CAMPEP_0184654258 /NCGR_PEP_ID=MMETSP0308-20130426/11960_1 /TAXON_ID=38269 /ORGANISM="Gloeochaete witrockiana, Strain SAG 46.84" /LENGTH=399 /DNA_ID=CAMNT_0027090171 /DNA_START=1113 /DNA_END=2312 /DNA_ORIENTATION=-